MPDTWTVPTLEKHHALLMDLGWGAFTALTAASIRALGNEKTEDLFERILRTHQEHYFLEGVRILGLNRERSDAVIAAKYHYYSNLVGGIRLGYAEESPDKAWVFYLSPDPMFDFGAGLAVLRPQFWVKVVGAWHAHNGESLGNPGLAVVITHAKAHGDPYDGVYFLDTHRSLRPQERLVISWGEQPPPMTIGDLESEQWPYGRRVNGLRNYHIGYIGAMVYHLIDSFGLQTGVDVLRHALAVLLVQRQSVLWDGLEVPRTHPFATALMLKRFQQLFSEDVSYDEEDGRAVVRQKTSRLHRVPEFIQPGARPFPVEAEQAITDAWRNLTAFLTPGVTLTQRASLAAGDGRLEWVFERTM